jgi:hypothetical protein
MSIPRQDVRLVIAGELSQQIRFCLPGHSWNILLNGEYN